VRRALQAAVARRCAGPAVARRARARGAALDPSPLRTRKTHRTTAMVLLTEQQDGPSSVSDKRLIIFAIYFDSKKTLAQGRKVPASLACENPNLRDIAECLERLKLPYELQARPARARAACVRSAQRESARGRGAQRVKEKRARL
jgi:signal recognition particle subunit SEC65